VLLIVTMSPGYRAYLVYASPDFHISLAKQFQIIILIDHNINCVWEALNNSCCFAFELILHTPLRQISAENTALGQHQYES